jgi:hypothetical protein
MSGNTIGFLAAAVIGNPDIPRDSFVTENQNLDQKWTIMRDSFSQFKSVES